MIVGALACDWRRGEVEQVVEAERENGEGGGVGLTEVKHGLGSKVEWTGLVWAWGLIWVGCLVLVLNNLRIRLVYHISQGPKLQFPEF